jgi:phosphatidylglycerophosphate synthase
MIHEQSVMDKVPAPHAFLDLSDYARPLARWLAQRLVSTFVTPIHLTLLFTVVGSAAALLFLFNRWLPLAGLLLLLKSLLDAADGSLARLRQKPSRVGRFLDSVCDFVVNALVFGGIASSEATRTGYASYFGLALAALICATLQGSVFSYYFVRYRHQVGGDRTSQAIEAGAQGYAWDDPAALWMLYALYKLIYSWQDRLMETLDRCLVPPGAPLHQAFLTATTVLGLGTQLLVIAVCAALGRPVWALWLFVTAFNFYWLVLLVIRRWLYVIRPHSF